MKTLTEVFSGHRNKNDAITLMEKEYQTEFPESMKKEMVNVCNWNEVFEERGMIKGREAGLLEGRQEGAEQTKIDNALRLIANGKLSLEDIASCVDLPLEKVQELAAKKSA